MSKKAEMSMGIIVTAAIALLILVILAVIFIGRMGSTTRGIDQCKGSCVATDVDCTNQGPYFKVSGEPCYKMGTKDYDTDKPVCCIGV